MELKSVTWPEEEVITNFSTPKYIGAESRDSSRTTTGEAELRSARS